MLNCINLKTILVVENNFKNISRGRKTVLIGSVHYLPLSYCALGFLYLYT